jgi:hypothetical protein
LKNVPETKPEACVQFAFTLLVGSICDKLDMTDLYSDSEIKFMVGGILANHDLDVKGASDPQFRNKKGQYLIASEVKTKKTFLDGEEDGQPSQRNHRWYQGTRGTQLLSTLYAFNCPTFLVTQTHWKLLVENTERNAIFTFPHGPSDTESFLPARLVQPMDETFIMAIVICLLSDRDALEQEMAKVALSRACKTDANPSSSMQALNLPSSQGPSNWPTSSETFPQGQELVTQGQGPTTVRVSFPILEPVFVSGYDQDQNPIYLPVRVYPPEWVAHEEEEIDASEKLEALAKVSSDMTLAE